MKYSIAATHTYGNLKECRYIGVGENDTVRCYKYDYTVSVVDGWSMIV